MNSSDQNPKLPMWIFYATDVVLIGAAWFIGGHSARPLSIEAAGAIVACIGIGALVGLVPLIARFERQKNEILDDRQRALESLARTVSSSAEQISIAANGLNEITELVQKNLRHADQLPHKLQEKIAEFQAQLVNANDADKEELEKELVALRTTESERLEAISDKIAKSTVEWGKLEAATHQHLTAASEALAKLAHGTAGAIGKAQAAAEQALAQARVEAARAVGEASGGATRALDSAKSAALAELEAKLAAAADRIAREVGEKLGVIVAALDEKFARLEAQARKPEPAPAPLPVADAPPQATPAANESDASATSAPAGSDSSAAPGTPPPPVPSAAHPGSENGDGDSSTGTATVTRSAARPRKPRRHAETEGGTSAPAGAAPNTTTSADAAPATETTPAPVDSIPEVAPDASHPIETSSEPVAPVSPEPAATASPVGAGTTEAPAVPPTPSRKRTAKKTPVEAGLALGIEVPPSHPAGESTTNAGAGPTRGEPAESARGEPVESAEQAVPEIVERVRTSDGATRLIVTAYIGIGNRLFIRGEGPGLSWEKGLPLQFVSIGKWRWETNEATGPVRFKLFKNDDQECTALGSQSLDPGHQEEVTAAF